MGLQNARTNTYCRNVIKIKLVEVFMSTLATSRSGKAESVEGGESGTFWDS
jgi:hypothetical protein